MVVTGFESHEETAAVGSMTGLAKGHDFGVRATVSSMESFADNGP